MTHFGDIQGLLKKSTELWDPNNVSYSPVGLKLNIIQSTFHRTAHTSCRVPSIVWSIAGRSHCEWSAFGMSGSAYLLMIQINGYHDAINQSI